MAAEIFASMKENLIVFSSKLARANETTQVIANKIKTSVNLFPDLHERYFGHFRLLTKEDCAFLPDAESETLFKERIFAAVSSLMNSEAFYGKKNHCISWTSV